MMDSSQNYNERFSYLRTDLHVGFESFIFCKHIHAKCVEHEDVLEMINDKWSFWVRTINCHVSNMIICLGKVFDNDSRSQSIFALEKWIKENKIEFEKESIKRRKISTGGTIPDVDNCLSTCHIFSDPDFQDWENKLNEAKGYYDSTIKPARNKIYAHRDDVSIDSVDQLLSGLSYDYLELVYEHANGLEADVWQGLYNGIKFSLSPRKYSYEEKTIEHLDWAVSQCMIGRPMLPAIEK